MQEQQFDQYSGLARKQYNFAFRRLSEQDQDIVSLLKKDQKSPQDLYDIKQSIVGIDFLNKFIGIHNPDMIEMCKYLDLLFCGKDKVIFKQGEVGDKFYIIISGDVSIFAESGEGKNKQKIQLAQIRRTQSFGELSLLFSDRRRATAQCTQDTFLMVLQQKHFQKFMKFRTNENSSKILEYFNKLDLFKKYDMDLPRKIQFVAKAELKEFVSNAYIIKQDQEADKLYFVKRGLLKVFRKLLFKNLGNGDLDLKCYEGPNQQDIEKGNFQEIQLEIDELYEQCCFPEYEFTHFQKHKYSIVSYTPCEVLVVSYKDIDIFLDNQYQDLLNNAKNYPPDDKLRKTYLEGIKWKRYKKSLISQYKVDATIQKGMTGANDVFNRELNLRMSQPQIQLNLSDDSMTNDVQYQGEEKLEQEIFKFLKNDYEVSNKNISQQNSPRVNFSLGKQQQQNRQQYQRQGKYKNQKSLVLKKGVQLMDATQSARWGTLEINYNNQEKQQYLNSNQKIQQSQQIQSQQQLQKTIGTNNNNFSSNMKSNTSTFYNLQNYQSEDRLKSTYNPLLDRRYTYQNPYQRMDMKKDLNQLSKKIFPKINVSYGGENKNKIHDVILQEKDGKKIKKMSIYKGRGLLQFLQ